MCCALSQVVALVARSDTQLSEDALQAWAANEVAQYQASLILRTETDRQIAVGGQLWTPSCMCVVLCMTRRSLQHMQCDVLLLICAAPVQYPDVQVPKRIKFVDAVPRNAMGKVNKRALLMDYFS